MAGGTSSSASASASASKKKAATKASGAPAPGSAPQGEEIKQAAQLGAAAFVLLGAGFGVRYYARNREPGLADIKKQLQVERVKEKRDLLIKEQETATSRVNAAFSIGTSFEAIAIGVAIMAVIVIKGGSARKASLVLSPFLLFAAVYSTTVFGIQAVAVFAVLGIAMLAFAMLETDPADERIAEEFRKYPARHPPKDGQLAPGGHPFRGVPVVKEALLKRVSSLPVKMQRTLSQIGGGDPLRFYQLHQDLAYVAFVSANTDAVSDYITVLMQLESPLPSFVVRPLPYLEGAASENGRAINNGLRFKKDPEFTAEYLVEVANKNDSSRVREVLTTDVRSELLDLPHAWLHVDRDIMALTIFGRFTVEAADCLLDTADFLFGEYGADPDLSLLEPSDVEIVGTPKKKKKSKSKSAPPAPSTAEEGAV